MSNGPRGSGKRNDSQKNDTVGAVGLPDVEMTESDVKAFRDSFPEGTFNVVLSFSPNKMSPVYKYLKDMELIHEIVINNEYELKRPSASETTSLYKHVQDIFHNAFWIQVEQQLNASPPDYNSSIQLIKNIREMILELLMPWQSKLKDQICEVLDMELIKQKIELGAFDINYYENYIISLMEKICAPVRDEDVAKLRQIHEVVPLFRHIVETLELMQTDMANFTIQQARPYLQQHYTALEKDRFKKYIEYTRGEGTDPLQRTKTWLQRSYNKLALPRQVSSEDVGACAGPSSLPGTSLPASGGPVTATTILNTAYIELVNWEDVQLYPETMCLDERRYRNLQEEFRRLGLMSAMLLVTYNTIGSSITGVTHIREQLKESLTILLEKSHSNDEKSQQDIAINCAEQVNSVVNVWLKEHGFEELDANKQKLLLGQLQEVVSSQHAVRKLMVKRINEFLYQCVCSGSVDNVKVPPSLSAVETELSTLSKTFVRLIGLNFGVCRDFYTELLTALLDGKDDIATTTLDTPENQSSPDAGWNVNVPVHE